MAVITPREFAGRNVDLVRQQWFRVLDVERDAVHDVRVALRRIRAATRTLNDASAKEIELCRVLGRALGRVRELDVTHDLLRELDGTVPAAACAIAAMRRDVAARRHRAAKRLVKLLDDLDVGPLARLATPHRWSSTLRFWDDWRVSLAHAVDLTTAKLERAMTRESTLYMAGRAPRQVRRTATGTPGVLRGRHARGAPRGGGTNGAHGRTCASGCRARRAADCCGAPGVCRPALEVACERGAGRVMR
jgi:hypothetical protein